MIRGRVLGAGAAALLAVLIISGCGSSSHSAQPNLTSPPGQTSSTTTAGSAPLAPGANVPAQDQSGQLTAIQRDVSQAESANSQALTDLNAAAAAQSQNDSP